MRRGGTRHPPRPRAPAAARQAPPSSHARGRSVGWVWGAGNLARCAFAESERGETAAATQLLRPLPGWGDQTEFFSPHLGGGDGASQGLRPIGSVRPERVGALPVASSRSGETPFRLSDCPEDRRGRGCQVLADSETFLAWGNGSGLSS